MVRVIARSVDEARRQAAHRLGAAPSSLEAEVVGARKSGLFGLGEPKLEVVVWVRRPAPEEDLAATPDEQRFEAEPVAAWTVFCRAGECFIQVHTPGPWLHEVEEHILLWPLDEYQRDAVRQALSAGGPDPVRFGLIAPPDEAAAERPFFIKIPRDNMSAWAVPGGGGQPALAELEAALAEAGVTWGIDRHAIEHAAEAPLAQPVLLARGTEGAPSRDASVEYLFSDEDEMADMRPLVREDGTVDYRELNPMYTVQPGTVVGRYLPAVDGEPGRNVFGQQLADVVPGRVTPAERFAGRDVQVANNGVDLVATKAGRPVREGARIDIIEVYAVVGDIDYSTGNVDFKGEVYVSGDVQPGFSVKATGTVRIDGAVDSASVESGRDLMIGGGIHGHGESRIVCGGQMTARFIDSADVACEDNLVVLSTIVRSNVQSQGAVTVMGRGSIVGGKVKAVSGITCNVAGSSAGVPTSLELDWISAVRPGPDRERDMARFKAARVVIQRDVYPGTTVTINGAKFPVRDQLRGVSFQAADRGIALVSAGEAALAAARRRR